MLHGVAGLSASAAIEILVSDDIHFEDHATHFPDVTIAEGESATVIGAHHAESGHSGSPYTHFFAETGDAHHFAWEDQNLGTPNVIDIYYDFRPLQDAFGTVYPNEITTAQISVVQYALTVWSDATAGTIAFTRNTTAPDSNIISIGTGNLVPFGQVSARGGILGITMAGFQHDTATHRIYAAAAWMDRAENWDTKINNGNPNRTYDYFTVAAHEIGHALGLGHTDPLAVSAMNLMQASYTLELKEASIDDLRHSVVVYGVPAGLNLAPSRYLETTEGGGSARINVTLRTPPTADVTITFTSDDATEGYVPDYANTLTFTPNNWDTPQIIFVYGVDDTIQDGNITYHVVTQPAVSADPVYSGLNSQDLTVKNLDNDKKGGGPPHGAGAGSASGSCSDDACALVAPQRPETTRSPERSAIVAFLRQLSGSSFNQHTDAPDADSTDTHRETLESQHHARPNSEQIASTVEAVDFALTTRRSPNRNEKMSDDPIAGFVADVLFPSFDPDARPGLT